MSSKLTPQLDDNSRVLPSVYVPGVGWAVLQGGTATTDANGVIYAPQVLGAPNGGMVVNGYSPMGYVPAFGSNAGATTATTDYPFKWGSSGTSMVNHIFLQNNTASIIQWDLDVAATAGSPTLGTGQTIFLDVQTSVLHLYTTGAQNVNGASGSNIVVRGWL